MSTNENTAHKPDVYQKATEAIASTAGHAQTCDECEALMIQVVFCHETGCTNQRKRYVDGEWVLVLKCRECGCDAREGEICCGGDEFEGELEQADFERSLEEEAEDDEDGCYTTWGVYQL